MKLAEDWMIDLEKNLYNGEKCPRIMRENMKEGFRAGMLAAADIVTDSARGFRLDREGVANKIRDAAK